MSASESWGDAPGWYEAAPLALIRYPRGIFLFDRALSRVKSREVTRDEEQDEQFYRDTESIAFPKLDDHQLSLLEPLGERRVLKRGELLFKAGQRDLGLTIVLRGEIDAFETRDGTEYNLATARERDFTCDI